MKSLALAPIGMAVLLAACTIGSEMPGPDEGAKLFAQNCTACHGANGTGGIGPDLTAIAQRNGGTFPRARMLSQIDGYAKGTHADRAMPEFGATLTGETVPVDIDGTLTPTPRPLAALLAYLESVQG
ncbi:MAG: cytochrome c [Rhodobacteraceae bacterium]|nr:MAG: cytochrome c [Paracoccaceae bacterium]